MAKKTQKKSVKTPLRHRIKTYNFFLVLAVIFGMIAGVAMVKVFYRGEPQTVSQPMASLGTLTYDLSSGKAVKRDSPEIRSLKAFLDKEADGGCSENNLPAGKMTVILANQDISQVLLGYGCGDTSAHMFAVRAGQSWKLISPTNHFDMLGIAECNYLAENSISKEVAPVCFTTENDAATYHVR